MIDCAGCGNQINQRLSECPWCGQVLTPAPPNPSRRRWTLGALIMLMTLFAILLGLGRLQQDQRKQPGE
ncbi:MAG: hypothetical protein AAFU85_26295 [Planctomycetota bacterium]